MITGKTECLFFKKTNEWSLSNFIKIINIKYYPFFQEMGGVEVPLCETLPRQLENASLPKSSAMGLLGKLFKFFNIVI